MTALSTFVLLHILHIRTCLETQLMANTKIYLTVLYMTTDGILNTRAMDYIFYRGITGISSGEACACRWLAGLILKG
jgi:hypothetical protein